MYNVSVMTGMLNSLEKARKGQNPQRISKACDRLDEPSCKAFDHRSVLRERTPPFSSTCCPSWWASKLHHRNLILDLNYGQQALWETCEVIALCSRKLSLLRTFLTPVIASLTDSSSDGVMLKNELEIAHSFQIGIATAFKLYRAGLHNNRFGRVGLIGSEALLIHGRVMYIS